MAAAHDGSIGIIKSAAQTLHEHENSALDKVDAAERSVAHCDSPIQEVRTDIRAVTKARGKLWIGCEPPESTVYTTVH